VAQKPQLHATLNTYAMLALKLKYSAPTVSMSKGTVSMAARTSVSLVTQVYTQSRPLLDAHPALLDSCATERPTPINLKLLRPMAEKSVLRVVIALKALQKL
jgi:hypothetical protein